MRISSSVLITSVALASLACFTAGLAVHAWLAKEQPVQLPHQRSPIAEPTVESAPAITARAQERSNSALDALFRVRSVKASTEFASDFDQSVSLHLLLARADENELKRYISESFSISSQNQRVAALAIIFGRYAAIDPNEALEQALTLTQLTVQERSTLIRSIFNEWTFGDLEAAVVALDDLPQHYKPSAASAIMWRSDFLSRDQRVQLAEQIGLDEAWTNRTVASIRHESAKADPRSAFYDQIRDVPHTQENYAELSGIVLHWLERDGVAILLEIHEALDNSRARVSVLQGLIWNAISTNTATPTEILNVVSDLPNKQDAWQTTEYVFRSWATFDPKKSFEASFEFTDPLVTRACRSSILRAWASKDADGLLTEASSFPFEYRNTAVIIALGRMSRDAPEAAIRHARNLDTHGLRSQAREAIIREWSEVDAKSAFEWFMNDSFNDDARDDYSIFWRVFTSYLGQDFESAQRYAEAYDGELKHRVTEAVARYLIDTDLERAMEYLPKVRVSARGSLQYAIGQEMAESRPLEALDYGATIHKERHDQYYGQLLGRWANRDFFSLHQNIQKVPHAYRGHAARDLLRINKHKSYLSTRDVRTLEDIVASAPPIVPQGE
ncbi:MAG: hypothetical protein OXG15_01015 [Gammaproteobacteria bacterium]|nr:hypothetical protein [Gammaproteobacteria bacterium]